MLLHAYASIFPVSAFWGCYILQQIDILPQTRANHLAVVSLPDPKNYGGNQVSFSTLCQYYRAAAILAVTYGGKLMMYLVLRDHSALSSLITVTTWFTAPLPLCAHNLVHTGKASHTCLAGLATKKIRGYNNSALHITSRFSWPDLKLTLMQKV